jgi:DNA-binding NarL/FixJ family response regulator
MPSHRVLIVDDHEPFGRFICSMLQERPGLQIAAEASDGFEAVRKADELQPNLIVVGIGLLTLDGIEAAQRISRVAPNAKVNICNSAQGHGDTHAVLSNGASGYVLKIDTRRELSPAVDSSCGVTSFSVGSE